jgi:hypothetical protein
MDLRGLPPDFADRATGLDCATKRAVWRGEGKSSVNVQGGHAGGLPGSRFRLHAARPAAVILLLHFTPPPLSKLPKKVTKIHWRQKSGSAMVRRPDGAAFQPGSAAAGRVGG